MLALVFGVHRAFLAWEGHPPTWDNVMDSITQEVLVGVADLLEGAVAQPEVRVVVSQLRALREEVPSLPAPPELAARLHPICEHLRACVDVTDLPDTDLAAVLCGAHALGLLAEAADSWGDEEVGGVCVRAEQFPASIWQVAAGAAVEPNFRSLFGCHEVDGDAAGIGLALPGQIARTWARARDLTGSLGQS